jgi:ankyrin repeat protein
MTPAEKKAKLTRRLLYLAYYSLEHNPEFSKLLREGADPNAADKNGWAVIHYVRSTKILALLKSVGGDLDRKTEKGMNEIPEGTTPLIKAVIERNEKTARALLWLGADITARSPKGNALIQARDKRGAKMLIEAGILKHLRKEELKEVIWAVKFGPSIQKLAKEELLLRTMKSLKKKPKESPMEI